MKLHTRYDLSGDLVRKILNKIGCTYSASMFQTSPLNGRLVYRGTIEEAQQRKMQHLMRRANIQPGQTILDIGFGWGGLSFFAAKELDCQVVAITNSDEQLALAAYQAEALGLGDRIKVVTVDYPTFAADRDNQGRFDRVLSYDMLGSTSSNQTNRFFQTVHKLLAPDGRLVMEAIVTPLHYRHSLSMLDWVFPKHSCPSLQTLVWAARQYSGLRLAHVDNIGNHYARTLSRWRQRFHERQPSLGLDAGSARAWNYYLGYCEAGFRTQSVDYVVATFEPDEQLLPALGRYGHDTDGRSAGNTDARHRNTATGYHIKAGKEGANEEEPIDAGEARGNDDESYASSVATVKT